MVEGMVAGAGGQLVMVMCSWEVGRERAGSRAGLA